VHCAQLGQESTCGGGGGGMLVVHVGIMLADRAQALVASAVYNHEREGGLLSCLSSA